MRFIASHNGKFYNCSKILFFEVVETVSDKYIIYFVLEGESSGHYLVGLHDTKQQAENRLYELLDTLEKEE